MQIHSDLLVPSCFIQTYDSVLNRKVVYACNESLTKGILFISNNVKLAENAYGFFENLSDLDLDEKVYCGVLKAFLYQPDIVKHHLMMESILLFFDYKEKLFYYLNMGLPGVFIKNSAGKFVELTDGYAIPEEEEFGLKPFPYFPMQEICHLYVASNELGALLYKKMYEEVFSEKDLLDYVNYLGENLLQKEERFSFCFINCEVSGEIEFKRHFTICARIESVEEVEMELEKLLNRFYDDLDSNAKTILVVNELLMNAYEHGVLGIDSQTKQEKMEEGQYDAFLKEREVKSKGCIDVEAVLYKSGVLKIMIDDHGKGFDFQKQLDDGLPEDSAYRGRGLMMSLNMANAVFYSKNGARVTFFVRYMLKEREAEVDAHLSDQDILRQMSVLYVEDEHMIQSLLTEVIKPKVKILYVASDGQEGLELFNRHQPDLVIADVNMPVLDGLKMAKFIKKINHNTPIIVTTAHDYEANLYRALEIGIDKFLTKPVELNHVNKVLKQFAKKVYVNKMLKSSGIEYDLERLRAKSSYLDCQQKKAFEKQRLIIHDDADTLAHFNSRVLYRPREILSGDMYGFFHLDDERVFVFVIDCMDLGMVASVNAVLSTAYINR